VRLEAGDIAHLPLACALVDAHGDIIAHSPEWRGRAPGTVSFNTGYAHLLVTVEATPVQLDVLMSRLLLELDATTGGTAVDQLRRTLIAAGLRLVAGQPVDEADRAPAAHVLALAHAGITGRAPDVAVEALPPPRIVVPAPAAIALALVQFAVNAHRHEGARRVRLRIQDGPTFYAEWPDHAGRGDAAVPVATHRHQERRRRWGWGYVQTVADALGATALPPGPTRAGHHGACIGLGAARLTLAAACVEDWRVVRSTDAWDQDVGAAFGELLQPDLRPLAQAAGRQRGRIVAQDLYRARAATPTRTWMAMPPQSGLNRARDVLRGLAHERALLNAAEPYATRIQALATLLGIALGDPAPTVPPATWDETLPEACAALGAIPPPEPPAALLLPEPRVTAFLLAELGGRLVEIDDGLRLDPMWWSATNPLLTALPRDQDGRVVLS
jgi:hypothetical protein